MREPRFDEEGRKQDSLVRDFFNEFHQPLRSLWRRSRPFYRPRSSVHEVSSIVFPGEEQGICQVQRYGKREPMRLGREWYAKNTRRELHARKKLRRLRHGEWAGCRRCRTQLHVTQFGARGAHYTIAGLGKRDGHRKDTVVSTGWSYTPCRK